MAIYVGSYGNFFDNDLISHQANFSNDWAAFQFFFEHHMYPLENLRAEIEPSSGYKLEELSWGELIKYGKQAAFNMDSLWNIHRVEEIK